jgi:hypothetical protein
MDDSSSYQEFKKHGGRRAGAGRPALGTPRSAANAQFHADMRVVKKQAIAAVARAPRQPIEVVMGRMNGEDVPELEYRAAIELLPYTAPRLQAVAVKDMTLPAHDPASRDIRIAELLRKGLASGAVTIDSE